MSARLYLLQNEARIKGTYLRHAVRGYSLSPSQNWTSKAKVRAFDGSHSLGELSIAAPRIEALPGTDDDVCPVAVDAELQETAGGVAETGVPWDGVEGPENDALDEV